MRNYDLVDADSHIIEPRDLWLKRLPSKYVDRAPHHVQLEKGDAWVFEGAAEPMPFGLNASGATPGGMKATDRRAWMRYEEVSPMLIDGTERLKALDQDGVRAAVLYPTPRFMNHMWMQKDDRGFQLALLQAYNEWLSEFASADTNRLGMLAAIPTTGLEDAMTTLRNTSRMSGFKGALLGRWPNGGEYLTPDDDVFFALAEEIGLPINIHVRFANPIVQAVLPPGRKGAVGDLRNLEVPIVMKEIITTGVFDRFPKLKLVFSEVDCGWVPYVKEQMDDRFKRLEPGNRPDMKERPSYYIERNLAFTFINDVFAIKNRHEVGLDSMLWSSDFPHSSTDWPHSREVIEKAFKGVPEDEVKQITSGNAATLYKFPL